MGERKGQNFYYPPDFDYKKHKTLNTYHGTHALRERAAKIKQGILIIRFEMPFNIWCLGCNGHIGMGVRYNAEKKKIGMYYTTPLYEFRMKCHLCDNYFTIRTDPEHFDYELVEGCRRQEKRYDPSTIGQLAAVDRTFNRQLEADKMFKVEHEEKDKAKSVDSTGQMETLEWIQERMRDDFAANQALRRNFRHEKQSIKDQRLADEDLQKRYSLEAIKLLPETDEDKKLAALTSKSKSVVASYEEQQNEIRSLIISRPLFEQPSLSLSSIPSTSSNVAAAVATTIKQDCAPPLHRLLSKKIQRKRLLSATSTTATTSSITSPFCSTTTTLKSKNIGVKLRKSAARNPSLTSNSVEEVKVVERRKEEDEEDGNDEAKIIVSDDLPPTEGERHSCEVVEQQEDDKDGAFAEHHKSCMLVADYESSSSDSDNDNDNDNGDGDGDGDNISAV